MAKIKTAFVCSECGAKSINYIGVCPMCRKLGTMVEEVVQRPNNSSNKEATGYVKAKRVNKNAIQKEKRIQTNIGELDRVLGGGIVEDSVVTLASPPGGGKSTLLLQAAYKIAKQGIGVVYASAEENYEQIISRYNRVIGDDEPESLYILNKTNNISNVFQEIEALDAKFFILDSIDMYITQDAIDNGMQYPTVAQATNVVYEIIDFCKNSEIPRCCILISQLTKNDDMTGSRKKEHAVDACFYLEYEKDDELRFLRGEKNRFGELETGIFLMAGEGMISVDNTAEFFTTQRAKEDEVPGVALTMIKEGTRSIVAEVEALVTKTYTPYPSRIATCLRKDNLSILLSIITASMGVEMSDYNVVINTTGGIKLSSKASDLAIIMSVLSALKKETIPNDYVFLAEVGLTGELKKVQNNNRLIKGLIQLGYKRVYVARNSVKNKNEFPDLEIIECKNINTVFAHIKNNR